MHCYAHADNGFVDPTLAKHRCIAAALTANAPVIAAATAGGLAAAKVALTQRPRKPLTQQQMRQEEADMRPSTVARMVVERQDMPFFAQRMSDDEEL